MPGFDVVPEELAAASSQLRQLGSEARSDLSRLVADAGMLLDGGWHGQAALAFQRGWAQWLAGADDVLNALEAMAGLLGSTGRGYDGADADSTRAFTVVGGQL